MPPSLPLVWTWSFVQASALIWSFDSSYYEDPILSSWSEFYCSSSPMIPWWRRALWHPLLLSHSIELRDFMPLLPLCLCFTSGPENIYLKIFLFNFNDVLYSCHVLLFSVFFWLCAYLHPSIGNLCLDSHSKTSKCHLNWQETSKMPYNLCASGSSLLLECFSSAMLFRCLETLVWLYEVEFLTWGFGSECWNVKSLLCRNWQAQFEVLKKCVDIPVGFRMHCGERTWGQKTWEHVPPARVDEMKCN